MTASVYRSPLRPLDIGYAARQAGVEIDWEHTDIGEWTPAARYAFTAPLPRALVEQMGLAHA